MSDQQAKPGSDQLTAWKRAIAAHNKAKRTQRWKRPPKPITGIVIMPQRKDDD